MWAIVDCDNFFCSCERVFRPDLQSTPLVVLSNNDGCVISRSNEAKAMGIQMGTPWYQLQDIYRNKGIVAFSSNYVLYSDLSARVMATLRTLSDNVFQYSIDEAFIFFGKKEIHDDLKTRGETMARKINQWVGIPASIGIGPTKTLAKVAVRFAKKYAGYNKCCLIATDQQRYIALKETKTEQLWGIGRRLNNRLNALGITSALDFANAPQELIAQKFGINGLRTWGELNGSDLIDIDSLDVPKKSIMTGRSFPAMINDLTDVRTHVANFASHCAAKLRRQHSACSLLTIFIDSNRFCNDLEQYHGQSSWLFHTATYSTTEIVDAAVQCLEKCFRKGIKYKRAAVMVSGLCPDYAIQADLFSFNPHQAKRLRDLGIALDNINRTQGNDTVVLASQLFRQRMADGKTINYINAIRHAFKSPEYSTSLDAFTVNCKI